MLVICLCRKEPGLDCWSAFLMSLVGWSSSELRCNMLVICLCRKEPGLDCWSAFLMSLVRWSSSELRSSSLLSSSSAKVFSASSAVFRHRLSSQRLLFFVVQDDIVYLRRFILFRPTVGALFMVTRWSGFVRGPHNALHRMFAKPLFWDWADS